MEYQIRQLSLYAEDILKNLTSGTVHSVYRRTINLTDGKQILALQAEGSPLSPISLILDLSAKDMEALSVKAGDKAIFADGGIHLPCPAASHRPAYHFTSLDAKRYGLTLTGSLDPASLSALARHIRTALSLAGTGGFAVLFQDEKQDTESLSLILLAAQNHILHSRELYLHGNYQDAALTLSQLLGLGTGLTPSGDDFLCGVLAGSILTGKDQHPFTGYLKSEIARRLSDTIDISAAFLSCALEGEFSLQVKSLLKLPAPEELLASFQEIGHSSGTDTLCGILWSLEHI